MNDHTWARLRHTLKTARGVSRRVAAARPYVPYEQGDTATVFADGRWSDLDPKQRGVVFTRATNLSSGIVIVKYPVPGEREPVMPQMRPDHPEQIRAATIKPWIAKGHDHAEYGDAARRAHVQGKAHTDADSGYTEDPDGLHCHASDGLAKYLLTPVPVETIAWEHSHVPLVTAESPQKWIDHCKKYEHLTPAQEKKLADHLKRYHPDGDETDGKWHGPHTRRGKTHRTSPEKRLDMNPLAAEMLADADTVFFSIEGSIKADALLSAGECSFAVPSVTMWSTPELGRFAGDYLAGKQVFVVPDADWEKNALVSTQAFLCADYLRQHGVRHAAVAYSPREKGIDDFLAAGGRVNEMRFVERVLSPEFGPWAERTLANENLADGRQEGDKAMGVPARRGYVRTVRLLSMLCDEEGTVVKPGRDLLKYVGVSPKVIEAALKRMDTMGALVDLEWSEREVEWPPPVMLMGYWDLNARWWEPTPVYKVRPGLCAVRVDDGATVGQKRGT